MGKEDMQIITRVRGILGKHFIDMDDVHITCSNGAVRLTGTFKRLGVLAEVMPVTEKVLHDISLEIKRVSGVRRVSMGQESEE